MEKKLPLLDLDPNAIPFFPTLPAYIPFFFDPFLIFHKNFLLHYHSYSILVKNLISFPLYFSIHFLILPSFPLSPFGNFSSYSLLICQTLLLLKLGPISLEYYLSLGYYGYLSLLLNMALISLLGCFLPMIFLLCVYSFFFPYFKF